MKVLLTILLLLSCSISFATPMYGVDVEERIVNPPNDQDKWYVSVVGEGEQYQKILGWFDTGKLKDLKDQVHFCQVKPTDPIYKTRYAPNIKGLPTVRLQDSAGYTIYEAVGDNIPMTGEGLYSAIAIAVSVEKLLPQKRKNRCRPNPDPDPDPAPGPNPVPPLDPAPGPLDDGGAPKVDPVSAVPWAIVLLGALALLAGSIWGQVSTSKEYHKGDK